MKIFTKIKGKNFRKIVSSLVLIFCLQIANAQVPAAQQQLYITFGGGLIQDLSPNAFPITTFGSPAPCRDRFTNTNCALRLFSSTDYLTIQYNSVFDMRNPGDAYSISMWYKGHTAALGDLEMLFNKTNPFAVGPIPSDYHVGIYDLNKPVQGYDYSPVIFHPIAPGGGWHHLVAMYDHTTTFWSLYVDNVPAYTNYTGPLITSSLGEIQIGGGWPAGVGFVGRIDDIVFYNRLLTVAEINQLNVDANSCTAICGCPIPSGLSFAGCTPTNTSQLQWTGNACALNYEVKIRNVTAGTVWVPYTSVAASFLLPTIPGNVYQWKVRSQCINAAGTITNSAWSPNNNFTALACRSGDDENLTQETSSLEIYPNPATNELTIVAFSDDAKITIMDISGKIVLEENMVNYTKVISIAQLNNGIYFIKIESGARSEIKKFVKLD